jgi:hypothetical protein
MSTLGYTIYWSTLGARCKHKENGNTFTFDPEELELEGHTILQRHGLK